MILKLDGGVEVVPNRKLAPFLIAETKRLAKGYGLVVNAEPDAEVPSADDTYIGRAKRLAIPSPAQETISADLGISPPPLTLRLSAIVTLTP